MKRLLQFFVWFVLGVGCVEGQTLFKLTFDADAAPDGLGYPIYRAAATDLLPDGLDFIRIPEKSAVGPAVEPGDGWQGGNVLALTASSQDRHLGYLVPRDFPRVPGTPSSGTFNNIPGLTMEAVVKIDRVPLQGALLIGQWGSGGIQPSLGVRETTPGTPTLTFSLAGITLECPAGLEFYGRWHHVAGVMTVVEGRFLLEIFLDGRVIGRKEEIPPDNIHSKMLVPYGGFGIGTSSYCAENPKSPSRTPTGKIDAVALTILTLDPATFLLPVKPQPTP